LNEPNATWWNANGGQEGARIDRPLQATLLQALRASLDARGLGEVELSAPDESSYDETVDSYNSYDDATRSLVQQINTHVYSGSKRTELRDLAARDGKRLWSSEVDGSGAPAPFDVFQHNHDDIAPGLDLANRITRDLRQMQSHAFVFWQAVESEQAQLDLNKNWGLLHGDFAGSSESYSLTKKYYVMMQYSRAIRPGQVMLDIDQPDAVVFYDTDAGRLSIVQQNPSDSERIEAYDLSAFAMLPGSARVTRTSSTENHDSLPDFTIVDGVLVANIAARSVTSFVMTGVAAP
jgi:O-glycosyl hydrolase